MATSIHAGIAFLVATLFAAPAHSAWQAAGPGGGGAFFEPALSPHDASLFVASDMTPLLASRDAGRSWRTIDFREAQGGRGARVLFTSDPHTLYLLNLERENPTPSISRDGGTTWQPLPASGLPAGETLALHADATRVDRLLAATAHAIYTSDDGGLTFVRRHEVASEGGFFFAGAVYAGTRIIVATSDGLMTLDEGDARFRALDLPGLPDESALYSLAGVVRDGELVLVASTIESSDITPNLLVEQAFETFEGVFVVRPDRVDARWTPTAAGIEADHAPVLVAAAPRAPGSFWLAGLDASDSEYPVVYRGDGFGAWQSVFDTRDNANVSTGWAGQGGDREWTYGGGIVGLGVDPANDARVAISDYGFVHVTEDGGETWRQTYVVPEDANPPRAATPRGRSYASSGLQNTSAWSIAWTSEDAFFAGFSDIRGVRTIDGGERFSFDYTGHAQNSMYRVVRHADGTLYAATATRHDIYQSTTLADAGSSRIDASGGRLLRSRDDGGSWEIVRDFGRAAVWVELDRTSPDRAYVAIAHSVDGGIYETSNLGAGSAATWRRLPEPPRTRGHAYNIRSLLDGALLVSYSGHRDRDGNFLPRSGVFLSDATRTAWSDRGSDAMRFWTKDVVVDPHDPTESTWFAAIFSGFNSGAAGLGGLYRTTNRGLDWERIAAVDRAESVTVDPDDPDVAYLTTEADGLFRTSDLTRQAPSFVPDAGFPFHQPVRVFHAPHDADEVWVTTFGGGLFRRDEAPPFESFSDGFE